MANSFTAKLYYIYLYTYLLMKQQAMGNLAVSVTYREWLGHHCGSLLSLAHHMKPLRPRDRCAAVDPPSPPFCSRPNVDETRRNGWTERTPASVLYCMSCRNNSNNTKKELECRRRRRRRKETKKLTFCLVTLCMHQIS